MCAQRLKNVYTFFGCRSFWNAQKKNHAGRAARVHCLTMRGKSIWTNDEIFIYESFFFLPAWSGCCGGQLSLSEVEAEREMAATAAVISDFLSTIKATGWSCSPSKSFDNSSDRILVCWPFCVSKRRACCSCKRFLNTKILGILAQILLLDCVKCFQKLFSCFSLSSLLPVLFFQGLWWTHERS